MRRAPARLAAVDRGSPTARAVGRPRRHVLGGLLPLRRARRQREDSRCSGDRAAAVDSGCPAAVEPPSQRHSLASDQPRRGAVPVGEIRRNEQAEHQHDRQCANTGSSAGGCGRRLAVVSPNTIGCTRPKIAANATPSASSRIGVAHGCCCIARRQDQELAREHAERRHAEDGERRRASVPSRWSGSGS